MLPFDDVSSEEPVDMGAGAGGVGPRDHPPARAATANVHVWRARRSRGGDAAFGLSAVCLVLGVGVGVWGATREPGPGQAGLVLLGCLLVLAGVGLLLWALAYYLLRYRLGTDALEIAWFGGRTRIPYAAIEGIYGGSRLGGNNVPRGRLRWPGIVVGSGRARGFGRLVFYGTSEDQSHQIVIAASNNMAVVLSPSDPLGFRSALIQHAEQVGEENFGQAQVSEKGPSVAPWSSLVDAWAPWCLGTGLVLLLVTLVAALLSYPRLPDTLFLRFDASGQPIDAGPRSSLLWLPGGGFLVLLVNWLIGVWFHPREPLFARILWVGAALVQVILLIALIRLLQQ